MNIPRWTQALCFTAEKHRQQRRKDGQTPYINHPLQVLDVLARCGGVEDETLLLAALLHDTLEDTETSPEELQAAFGPEVCALVQEVSDDKTLPQAQRKALQIVHATQLSPRAKQLKLADKICNLRDLLRNPPQDWSLERKQAYFDWARQVAVGLRGVNPALEALFDQLLARQSELAEAHS